mgnify:CR=1 FL=1
MIFNFKTVIEDYCGTGKLSEEEVDFLEREHIKTMSSICETSSPSIAHWNICLLYTSPSPRDLSTSRMPSSA